MSDPVIAVGSMMQAIVFTVYGNPAPQGSKRHVGRGIMVESSAAVKPWREAIKWAVITGGHQHRCFTGPLIVEFAFTLRKPVSAPKWRITYPQRKPDVDKLLRAGLDALSDSGIWRDDAQVIDLRGRKLYPGEGNDALDRPGAVIRIRQVAP